MPCVVCSTSKTLFVGSWVRTQLNYCFPQSLWRQLYRASQLIVLQLWDTSSVHCYFEYILLKIPSTDLCFIPSCAGAKWFVYFYYWSVKGLNMRLIVIASSHQHYSFILYISFYIRKMKFSLQWEISFIHFSYIRPTNSNETSKCWEFSRPVSLLHLISERRHHLAGRVLVPWKFWPFNLTR